MEENIMEDPRRYKFWFKINNHDPFQMNDFITREYLKLKHNRDNFAYEYILKLIQDKPHLMDEGETLEAAWISIDDVEYVLVDIPPSNIPPNENLSQIKNPQNQELLTIESSLTPVTSGDPDSYSSSSRITIPSSSSNANPTLPNIPQSPASTGSKMKSNVWKYFSKETPNSAKCIICEKIYKSSGNTSNLKQHLQSQHKLLLDPLVSAENSISGNKKRRILKSLENLTEPSQISKFRNPKDPKAVQDEITNLIIYMISVDRMPLSLVENDGFSFLLETILPSYKIPSRKTITTLINTKYLSLKEIVVQEIKNIPSYSLTCDIWTDITNQSYIGVTIHYLSSDKCHLTKRCLSVNPLYERHTAANIQTALLEIIASFEINIDKITAVVSDNGANIKKAVEDVFGVGKRLPCFAHIISHLVPDVMKMMPVVEEIVDCVKNIVACIRRSVVATDHLKLLQIRDGKSEGTALKIINSVPTRWNSTFYMLERFLILYEYICCVLVKLPNSPENLNKNELTQLKDLVYLMEPVKDLITEISGDNYPTCSIIIPIIDCMKMQIHSYKTETDVGREFQDKLLEYVDRKLGDYEKVPQLAISTILDPRYKQTHFRKALYAATAISKINKLIDSSYSKTNKNINFSKDAPQKKGIWSFHDNLVNQQSGFAAKTSDGSFLETRQYLNQPLIQRTENPLNHWQLLRSSYPHLHGIAMQYLCIVGTSVPTERLFSKAGAIKSHERNRLTSENLHELLFLSTLTRKDWGLD